MHRRQILAALPFAFAAGAALANEEPKKDAGSQYIDLLPVALPIVVNGRLVNYIFCSLRVNLSPSADAAKARTKEPWIRDAIVRAGHRTPFTLPNDYARIDEARLKAVLLRETIAIVGARNVVSVTLTKQTPKQRVRAPGPPPKAH